MRHRSISSASTPRASGICSEFLAWPGGASLLYLVSAALLLAGVGLTLAPGAGLEEHFGEQCLMIGVVACYTGALLGVACLVCHWQRAHEDAIALSILIAFFTVAVMAPLNILAVQHPALTAGLALMTGLGVVGVVRVWSQRVGGTLPLAVAIGGGFILLGALAAPVLLGRGSALIGRPDPVALMFDWQVATAAVCIGLTILWVGSLLRPASSPWPLPPRLLRANFRWILAYIVGLTAIAQLWLMSYSANLGLSDEDLLVPLILLVLAVDAHAEQRLGVGATMRRALWAMMTMVPLLCLRSGSIDPALAPLTHPALAIAIGAIGLGWAARRSRDVGLATIGLVWIVLATAGAGAWVEQPHLMFFEAGCVALVAVIGLAIGTRRPSLAVIAVLMTTVGMSQRFHLPFADVALLLGGQLLGLHLVFGRQLASVVIAGGAACTAFGLCGMHAQSLVPGWTGALLSCAAMFPGVWRDPAQRCLLTPLALPLAGRVAVVLWHQLAWSAVGGAFVLLVCGAWMSRRSAKRARG